MAVERRLELLKLEGLGFSQPEIVKELSKDFHCSERAVYHDFECRDRSKTYCTYFFGQLNDQDKKVLIECLSEFT